MKKQGLIAGFALTAAMALSPYGISAASGAGPAVGDKAEDGTVYAGVWKGYPGLSDDEHKPLYTTPADAPGLYEWADAMIYCENLKTGGHRDWHAPSEGELAVLFSNRAAIGGFNETGSYPDGWYWSSSPYDDDFLDAWAQRFSDGNQAHDYRYHVSSLRCVR
jgi:hypothetical protein